MSAIKRERITVSVDLDLPPAAVWQLWTQPEHIVKWNFASDDWHTPWAENDLRIGGSFCSRMEAKDGSAGFDNAGTYIDVVEFERIEFEGGGRNIEVLFQQSDSGTRILESFDPEDTYPLDVQRQGWQSILNNFKRYAEQA